MSRLLLSLLEALGLAFCEKGRKSLQNYEPFGNCLIAVCEKTLLELRKHMPADQIRVALAEAASYSPEDYAAVLENMMKVLCRVQSVPFKKELHEYLTYLPLSVRQVFHRPSDPAGITAPEKLDFYKAEQLLPFLPARRPHFQPGARPDGLDHWELRELRGLGECGEVWLGYDDEQPEHSPAALKFAIEKESKKRITANAELFRKVFELNEVNGIVPLRSVYLETDPPCLEYAFVSGYDLSGMMHEWRWRFDHTKPDAALKLIKRIAEIVGQAHKRGVVHRDLKPSNLLIHPTDEGRNTLWITDFGWGQIEAVRSLELHRTGGTTKPDQTRLALRGAYTPLYASPQQSKNEPAAPTDDVHAIGVLWHQLLKRDPHATAPVGDDWYDEFLPHGFTKTQAHILSACVATRPDKRPADANVLLEMIEEDTDEVPIAATTDDGSKVIPLKKQGSSMFAPLAAATAVATPATPKVLPPPAPKVVIGAPADGGTYAVAGKSKAAAVAVPTKAVRNSLGMYFVPIPAGTFEMGADNDEEGHRRDETPRHTVRIARSFYLSITPVTQAQFEKLMARNPAFFSQRNGGSPDFPVESISWYDAERFCQKLTRYGDEDNHGRTYRLPTEAEWEYACRAGTTSMFSFGDGLLEKDAHYAAAALKGQGRPCSVGQHPANAWGLKDMHGNVDEWCSDWYSGDYYIESPGTDPKGPGKGDHKVCRGGDWAGTLLDCRSAARKHQHPDKPLNTLGFRVVMLPPGK